MATCLPFDLVTNLLEIDYSQAALELHSYTRERFVYSLLNHDYETSVLSHWCRRRYVHSPPSFKFQLTRLEGGTNTDAALAIATFHDPAVQPEIQIIASSKQPTTTEATEGIRLAIQDVIRKSNIATSDILSINIGTTHFINAVVQADASKLERVAVLRLCGPFCREVPPFADFPDKLSSVIHGPVGYLDGGLECMFSRPRLVYNTYAE